MAPVCEDECRIFIKIWLYLYLHDNLTNMATITSIPSLVLQVRMVFCEQPKNAMVAVIVERPK